MRKKTPSLSVVTISITFVSKKEPYSPCLQRRRIPGALHLVFHQPGSCLLCCWQRVVGLPSYSSRSSKGVAQDVCDGRARQFLIQRTLGICIYPLQHRANSTANETALIRWGMMQRKQRMRLDRAI